MRKLTLEEFKINYFERFPESKIEIIENSNKDFVIIKNKYGLCNISKNSLITGHFPNIKSAIDKTEYFKSYINTKIFNIDYTILKYIDTNNVIIQDYHSLHLMTSTSLIAGNKPNMKSSLNKSEYFLNNLNSKKYSNISNYNFSNFHYKNYFLKSEIHCLYHGKFFTTPSNLLAGKGCNKCGRERIFKAQCLNPIGWTKTNWLNAAKNSKNFDSFKVYIIKMFNNNEEFYKIGRTFTEINKRFHNKINMPYKYEIIKIYEFKELTRENCEIVFNLEKELKIQNKKHKYIPKIKFKGMQECFKGII